MGQTAVEKILAAHSDVESATAGDIIRCRPDLIVGHDLAVPLAVDVFHEFGMKKAANPEKLVIVQDHFQPAKDVQSAALGRATRRFALEQGVGHYYEVGWGGICHLLIMEKGLVRPGMLITGGDSHTPTCGAFGAIGYGVGATDLAALWALGEIWLDVPKTRRIVLEGKPQRFVGGKDIILAVLGILGQEGAMNEAIEYSGGAFEHLSISDRITIANMSAETGAATAFMSPDDVRAVRFQRSVSSSRALPAHDLVPVSDPDATYVFEHRVDVSELGPMVAAPHSPANVAPVEEYSGVEVDQVFLGSCSNGSIEDLRRFIEVVGDRTFSPKVRVLVTPATQEAYRLALNDGIVGKIVDAGGAVQTPSCGPCIGGHGGVLGAGEVCLSTTNRNFKGRMGHPGSLVYLAGPEVAAATAVAGSISHPAEVADATRAAMDRSERRHDGPRD